MTNWCSHMDIFREVELPKNYETGKPYFIGQEWIFCPICGTKRPEPQKELWQALYSNADWVGSNESAGQYYHKLAEAAKTWFLEKIDEEGIRGVIEQKELIPVVCEDSGQAEWSRGEALKLAKSIKQYISDRIGK